MAGSGNAGNRQPKFLFALMIFGTAGRVRARAGRGARTIRRSGAPHSGRLCGCGRCRSFGGDPGWIAVRARYAAGEVQPLYLLTTDYTMIVAFFTLQGF